LSSVELDVDGFPLVALPFMYALRKQETKRMPAIRGQLITHDYDEEKLIRRLGRAVALQWAHIPTPTQERILRQAWMVFDSEPITDQLKQELEAFVTENAIARRLEPPAVQPGVVDGAPVIGNPPYMMEIAADEVTEPVEDFPSNDGKDKAAQALGRKGGKKRAENLTPERRAEIA
jgi:hypothetical protein